MQKLFNSYFGPKTGISIDPNWQYVKSGLQRNISQAVLYYRTKNFSVKSNHLLVNLLDSSQTTITGDVESFYNQVQDRALRLASIFNMTSSVSYGKVFDGVFFGKGSKEVIIATDDPMNPLELEANWQDIESVKFLDHPKSDTSLLLANGKAYSDEDGYSVLSVNIPALLVQYRCWLKEQKAREDAGEVTFSPAVFVHKYILPNLLNSQLDVAVFNRINNLVKGAPMGVPKYRHSFVLVDYDARLDKALLHSIKQIQNRDQDFFNQMRQVPLINVENLLQFSKLPENAPTYQIVWAELIARIKLISFLIDANPSKGIKQSRQYLNDIKRIFDHMDKGNGLQKVDDKALIREIEAEMISIRTVSKMGY